MQKAPGIKQGAFTVFRANRWLKGIFRKTPDHCPCTQYITAAAQYYKQDILQKTTVRATYPKQSDEPAHTFTMLAIRFCSAANSYFGGQQAPGDTRCLPALPD